jgi:Tfp pilus tip-associated adhesin PilY1
VLFASTNRPGFTWRGELAAYAIDPDTGVPAAAPTTCGELSSFLTLTTGHRTRPPLMLMLHPVPR